MRFNRKYDYQRAKCEDAALIRAWFSLVEKTIAQYSIRIEDIYNFDETGFMMDIISSSLFITGVGKRGKVKSAQARNKEWVTIIQGINAKGWSAPPFIVVAGRYNLSTWYTETDLPADWAIDTTKDGWTDKETGFEWLKQFDKHITKRSIGQYRLLTLDGHESHHSTEFELFYKDNNIFTLCMPPHASNTLQPLDVGRFGPLKTAYGRQIDHLIRSRITHISKDEFLEAFQAALRAAITKSNIQ